MSNRNEKWSLLKIILAGLFVLALSVSCGQNQPTPVNTGNNSDGGSGDQLAAPTNFNISARDKSVHIRFDFNSLAVSYRLYFGTTTELTGLGSGYDASPMSTTANVITIGNLTNGTTYYFAISSIDASGTESEKTQTLTAVPVVN